MTQSLRSADGRNWYTDESVWSSSFFYPDLQEDLKKKKKKGKERKLNKAKKRKRKGKKRNYEGTTATVRGETGSLIDVQFGREERSLRR